MHPHYQKPENVPSTLVNSLAGLNWRALVTTVREVAVRLSEPETAINYASDAKVAAVKNIAPFVTLHPSIQTPLPMVCVGRQKQPGRWRVVTNSKNIQNKRGVLLAASPTGLKLEAMGYPDNSCALTINDLQKKLKLLDGNEDHKDTFYVGNSAQTGSVSQGRHKTMLC